MLAALLLALLGSGCATAHSGDAPGLWSDPLRALTQADTFSIRVNGQAIGTQVVMFERIDDGYRFRETTSVGGGSQTTDVLLTSSLGMRGVAQRGMMAGQEVRIDVAYGAGRATGHARTPGPDGMKELVVDAAVPSGVIDDNVLAALLPALDWRNGAAWELSVFHSGRNELSVQTLRVTGTEDVELNGVRQPAWRAELTGGDTPLVFSVATVAPHRLLRIEVPGTPMDVIRVR
jgi:hypothetical protein